MIYLSPVKISHVNATNLKKVDTPTPPPNTDTINFRQKLPRLKPSSSIRKFIVQNLTGGSFIEKTQTGNFIKNEFKNRKLVKSTHFNPDNRVEMIIQFKPNKIVEKIFLKEDGTTKSIEKYKDGKIIEETGRDKFDKKYIKKFKNEELVETTLFKTILGTEYPLLILKYKKDKLTEAQELRMNGTPCIKRKYDPKTGNLIDEKFIAKDGKTETEY